MIINNFQARRIDQKYVLGGVFIDSYILLVFIISEYVIKHPEKRYLIQQSKVTNRDISCLSDLIVNLRIERFIITPYIFSEFVNRLREDYKEDFRTIQSEFLKELKELHDQPISKNKILNESGFIEYGNDISIFLASKEYIIQRKHCLVISKDGRFLNKFFSKQTQVYAIDMQTMAYFYP